MNSVIAERRLICQDISTGMRKNVTIRIGAPYWAPNDAFASCPIEFEGLFDEFADAKGVDSLQALQQAADIDDMLQRLRHKYEFFWESGDPYFDID